MQPILFKGYQFEFEPGTPEFMIDQNSLVFFKTQNEVMIHISVKDDQLILKPRYGVSFQKLATKKYKIIKNQ